MCNVSVRYLPLVHIHVNDIYGNTFSPSELRVFHASLYIHVNLHFYDTFVLSFTTYLALSPIGKIENAPENIVIDITSMCNCVRLVS